jgi:LacI family transcriptional regulator
MPRANKSLPLSPGAKPASLRTIADHLGLSTAAVSRVLSGAEAAKSIPAPTQKKIHDAAALFNYRPNVLARSLRSRRSLTVGVMVPEVSEGYATLVLSGIEQRLLEAGFFYLVVSHHHRPELIERYPELLLARAVEGLIAIDTPLTRRLDVPTVTVSGHHEPPGVTNILLNHRRAAALAIDHLAALRHRRIAFIQGQAFSSDTRPRWNAIRQAMASAGLRIDPAFVTQLEGDAPTHEPGYLATQRLLAAQARLPRSRHFTALFAFNDISAIGAIRALREAGLRVPEDVSVIGFDDVQSAAFQNPALTTVRQPLQQMGQLAAQTVLNQIENQIQTRGQSPSTPVVSRHINRLVEPELICRNSTAPAPIDRRSS